MSLSNLPSPVAAFIAAHNAFDLDGLMAPFSEDALVNDHRDEFRGPAAIRDWAAREIVGDRVTMRLVETVQRGASVAVAAEVDGDFDKTGLPDPLVLTYYFTVTEGRIVQLIIVLNHAPS